MNRLAVSALFWKILLYSNLIGAHRFVAHLLAPLVSLTLLSDFLRDKLCLALETASDFLAFIAFLVRPVESRANFRPRQALQLPPDDILS